MIGGERVNRRDSASKRWASRWANGLRRRLLDDGASDTGCGLKVFRREAYLRLPYFDHQHRYLPALMIREGYRVAYEPVGHRARDERTVEVHQYAAAGGGGVRPVGRDVAAGPRARYRVGSIEC